MKISDFSDTKFDLSKFKKIENIIFFDEPILTHLMKGNKNYFLYLVDSLELSDIYLLFELDESDIYKYLTGKKSLYQIINENENIINFIELDFEGSAINTEITHSSEIKESYLPSVDSFLNYRPTPDSYYYNFISEYESKSYLNILKDKAFYLKIGVIDKKYANTIGFNQLVSNYITRISSSFKSFLKADFNNNFKVTYSDINILDKKFKAIESDLDYRMVDLKCASFEIGLAIDNVMKGSIGDTSMKVWAIQVGDKYKELVLENSFNEESINVIINEYTEEDRKKIYEPIFKIIENTNVKLQIKNSKDSTYSIIKSPNKHTIEKIIPKKTNKVNDEKDLQIVNLTTVIDKNKSSKSIIITDGSLFSSTHETEVHIENKDFEKYGHSLDFTISLNVKIETIKDIIYLTSSYDNKTFQHNINTGRLEDGLKCLINSIYEYIINKK